MVMKLRAKGLLRKACIALCREALQNLGNSAIMERNMDGMQEEMSYLGSVQVLVWLYLIVWITFVVYYQDMLLGTINCRSKMVNFFFRSLLFPA